MTTDTAPELLEAAPTQSADAGYSLIRCLIIVFLIRAAVFAAGVYSIRTAQPSDLGLYASGRAWVAFDSLHYQDILLRGYPAGPNVPMAARFFPLFPIVSRWVVAMGASPEMAMLWLANIAGLIGFVLAYAWCLAVTEDRRFAFWGTILTASLPTAVYLSMAQTEGMFFFGTAIVLWALQKEKLWLAAIASAVSSAVRPTGVALAAMIVLWAWLRPAGGSPARRVAFAVSLGVVALSGMIVYQVFLWRMYHRFDAFSAAQSTYVTEIIAPAAPPKKDIAWLVAKLVTPQAWNRGMALLLLVLIVAGLASKRLRGPIPWVTFVMPLIIFLIGFLPDRGARQSSLLRFEVAALPCFLMLAMWSARPGRKAAFYGLAAAGLAVQFYYAYLFSRAVWVG